MLLLLAYTLFSYKLQSGPDVPRSDLLFFPRMFLRKDAKEVSFK